MPNGGWVASDATINSLEGQRPDWVSLVSVAVAVSDIEEFDTQYATVLADKSSEYGVPIQYPVVKSEEINRWCSDWFLNDFRQDLVTQLLQIDVIENIEITETSLHSQWVTVFSDEASKRQDVKSEDFIDRYLQSCYNLTSIWEYLRTPDTRPETFTNVLTDDFSGMVSPAWIEIGEEADEIRVIPKGDQTYPLLSLADLTMEFVKQETDDWDRDSIQECLEEATPADDHAYVYSNQRDREQDLEKIAPHRSVAINTNLFYPSPVFYINSGSYNSSAVESLDFFNYLAQYAQSEGGCVKFFDANQDRDYLTTEDYIVCMDGNTSSYEHLSALNDKRSPEVISADDMKDILHDELSVFEE